MTAAFSWKIEENICGGRYLGRRFWKDVINTVIDLFFTAGDFPRQISFIFYKVSYLCNIPLGVFKN